MDKQLLEYLEHVVTLEKSVYTQTQTIQELEDRIDILGIHADLREPPRPYEYEPNWFNGTGTAMGIGAFLGGLFGLFGGFFLGGIFAGAILGFVLVICSHTSSGASENKRRAAEYEAAKAEYDTILMMEARRIDEENEEKEKLTGTLQMMKQHLAETKNLLEQYYSTNIIFPKYRNLITICSFYEYFLSGRCVSLTGHEGAYNIYESEVRLERICTKLDEVVLKLEDIKTNQYVLFDAIQEGNRTMSYLVDASIQQAQRTEQLIEATEVNTYYQRQTASEANQIKWLMLYESTNNG